MQSILADLTDDCSWSCHWVQMREPQHVIFSFERGIRSAYKPHLTYKFWLLFQGSQMDGDTKFEVFELGTKPTACYTNTQNQSAVQPTINRREQDTHSEEVKQNVVDQHFYGADAPACIRLQPLNHSLLAARRLPWCVIYGNIGFAV